MQLPLANTETLLWAVIFGSKSNTLPVVASMALKRRFVLDRDVATKKQKEQPRTLLRELAEDDR
eukprot:3474609-Amphidinium_carterae.1